MAMVIAIAAISNITLAIVAKNLSTTTITNTVHQLMESVTDSAAGKVKGEVEKTIRMTDGSCGEPCNRNIFAAVFFSGLRFV